MKKPILLLISLSFISLGCTLQHTGASRIELVKGDVDRVTRMEAQFDQINKSMIERGYLEVDELEKLVKLNYHRHSDLFWGSFSTNVKAMWGISRMGDFGWTPHISYETLSAAVNREYLPFSRMFYLSIEKENFDEAENIRIAWVHYLNRVANFFKEYAYWENNMGRRIDIQELCFRKTSDPEPRISRPYKNEDSHVLELLGKIQRQIQNLTNTVGLTDPMLVTLRKELMVALKEKRWDDAQKIQNIITARVKELTPAPQPIVIGGGTQTPVMVEQPSKIQVEHLPRYGVSDYARVLSIMGGKTMTSKDTATLKLFDMILGR